MKGKNPKLIAGAAAAVILLFLCVAVIVRMIPVIGKVSEEMSLTPTPLPAIPDTVRASLFDPTKPTAAPALTIGSQGERVWELQQKLQDLGYYTGVVDGQFGPGTKEAVIAFQKQNGLDADGLAGEETLSVLKSEAAKPYSNEQ